MVLGCVTRGKNGGTRGLRGLGVDSVASCIEARLLTKKASTYWYILFTMTLLVKYICHTVLGE
jgi:hypothetical protein